MGKIVDVTGQQFGYLRVIRLDHVDRRAFWLCECCCGAQHVVCGRDLRSGNTRSCGCQQVRLAAEKNSTHGYTRNGRRPPEWNSWRAMKERCTNPNHVDYQRYGGRGISICARWADDFAAFLADMGPRPPKHSLDRINNDGDYSPDNCRWADSQTQSRTNRGVRQHLSKLSPSRVREIRRRAAAGETRDRLASEYGVSYSTIRSCVLRRTWRHVE